MTGKDNPAMERLVCAAETSLERAGLMKDGARLIAAVSGGADSVALLCALCRLRKSRDIEVIACHVQHGLRGENSLADEAYTHGLCDSLNIRCDVRRAELSGGMDDAGAETRARNERMRLFDLVMRENAADALLLAHHMNDQAETALMRLIRGAGAAGLCAMPPLSAFSRGVALRPFIGIAKRDIVTALEAEGISWREDESNAVPCTPRNALRLKAMPMLEALYPEAQRHIANAAEALRADEECLSALADGLYKSAALESAGILALNIPKLQKAPDALRRRALRRLYARALELAGLKPDERSLGYDDTLALCELIISRTGGTLNLPCELRAFRGADYLHITRQDSAAITSPPTDELAVTADVSRYALAGVTIRLEALINEEDAQQAQSPLGDTADTVNTYDTAKRGTDTAKLQHEASALPHQSLAQPPRDARTVWLPLSLLAQSPVLRTPRAGDTIRPLGAGGSKPLRRYLTDIKLDAPFRAAIPVMAIGSRVLWLPGLCTAEELRAAEGEHITMYIEGDAPFTSHKGNNAKE